MTTFTENTVLAFETHKCGGCGIHFALPAGYLDVKRKEAGSFYCPNGCYRGWSETEATRLQKRLDDKERELTAAKSDALRQKLDREMSERRELELKRKLNRAHKGCCPHCQRSFANLQRHIANKHAAIAGVLEAKHA